MLYGTCDACGEDTMTHYYAGLDAWLCLACLSLAPEVEEELNATRTEVDRDVDACRANERMRCEANEREPLPVGDGEPW